MSDISDMYLKARERANAVNGPEWESYKRAGADPGQAMFEEPVYDNIEKRIVENEQHWVGVGDEDKPDGEEVVLFSEEAPKEVLSTRENIGIGNNPYTGEPSSLTARLEQQPELGAKKKPEPLFGGEPSISNRGPLTMREKFQFGTQDALIELFGFKPHKAVELSKKLFGGSPEDTSAPGFGIGLADLMGLGEIFAIEEGLNQAERGNITGDKSDELMGTGIALAGSIAPAVIAKRIISSPQARNFLQEAKDRFEAGMPVINDAIIEAGQSAEKRLSGAMSGATLSANPVGAIADAAIAGTGKVAQKLKDTNSSRISTRLPTAVNSTEDAVKQDLGIGLNEIKSNPEVFDHNVGITKDYPNLRLDQINGTSDEISETYINHMKDNLLWLHDKVPENTRARSKLWYDGANKVANDWATEFNLPPTSVAGVLASLSPQKDWFMNASLGRRVLDIMANKQDEVFSDKMLEVAVNGYVKNGKKIPGIFRKPKFAEMLNYIKTKKLSELETSTEKAMWLRLYDEANNPSQYKTLSPEGEFTTDVLNDDGTASSIAWNSLETIAKAINSFESGGDVAKLTPLMGNKHKVRNFYNNIIDPNSVAGDVTIDTHAVAGATLRPVSGNSTIVHHNFGTSPEIKKRLPDWNGAVKNSSVNGVQGLYGLYAEAFRRAGAERGILPREMQSITWEAVRGLYTKGFKQSKQNVEKIDNLWYEYRKGNLSLDEVRNGIEQSTGGINPPSWE